VVTRGQGIPVNIKRVLPWSRVFGKIPYVIPAKISREFFDLSVEDAVVSNNVQVPQVKVRLDGIDVAFNDNSLAPMR
jgi:hypothetical protein